MRYVAMCLLVLAGTFAAGCAKEPVQPAIPQAGPTGPKTAGRPSPVLTLSETHFISNDAEKKETKAAGVGVVDFPLLLAQLGFGQKIEDRSKMAEQQLTAMQRDAVQPELKTQAALQTALDAAARAAAKTRPDIDKETLGKDPVVFAAAKAKYDFDRRLQAYAGQYQQALDKYKQSLLESWTAACMPAMGKVGPAAGVNVILAKATVAWNAADADLTSAMVDYIKTNNPEFVFPPPPKWETIIIPMDKIMTHN